MNNSQVTSSKPSNTDDSAYIAALNCANARSFHSYFNQYILTDFERGYIVIDEGDYGALPPQLMDRVIDSVPGRMSDEY